MNKTTGLILGKVAPMHKGHQYLIDTALDIVDELIFVVYDCPDRVHIPTNVRANWIRQLYPQVNVIEGWDAPNEHNNSDLNVQRKQELFISKVLRGKKITHFISSESYGEHMSRHLNAENVVVDMDRAHINISSTMIRENMKKYVDYLPEIVYRDLVTKIAITGFGLEESNKITRELANHYKTNLNEISLQTPESLEELQSITDKKLDEFMSFQIFKDSNNFTFFNNTLLDNYVVSEGILREYNPELFEKAIVNLRKYDIVLFNSSENGVTNNVENIFLNNQIKSILDTHHIPYIQLEGSHKEKMAQAMKAININFKKKLFHE